MNMLRCLIAMFALSYSQVDRTGEFRIINESDKCEYRIQISENDKILATLQGEVEGQYGWYGGAIGTGWQCYIYPDDNFKKKEIELGKQSFSNSRGEVCFLNAALGWHAMSGFFTSVYWFTGISLGILCENPASIPDYCGKSERYAKQVLLENHRAQCDSLGGAFDGNVYQKTLHNGEKEHCVSGSCNACDSEWRNEAINGWKEEVCCEERGMEPNTNNGSCRDPSPPDSNKIGIGYSKITAFPGCSATPVGDSENSFCRPPSSSSADAYSSSQEQGLSSSSQSGHSSSSEEMEDAECYSDITEASAAIAARAWQCERAGKDSGFKVDRRGCVSGECNERSSSSSSLDLSSSSDASSSSSYSSNCYHSLEAAWAEIASLKDMCWAEGGHPDFYSDSDNCILGECFTNLSSSGGSSGSSSSSDGRSSSSGEGGDGVCAVSKSFLKKESGIYDDWVYMGKETYGSRVVTRSSFKPGTKFFDVLGRMYDKMKAKIQYYVRPEAVKREERKVPKEFEVWTRIVKDEDGNDIQMFIKEDKRNGLRKDSSFYFDGRWRVTEKDDLAKTIKYKSSLGIKITRLHDEKWHLTNKLITDENSDTLVSEQYIWKVGKLVKMIENGMERIYTYGKTSQDPVKVNPSDEGLYFHPGYDNSIGMMPDESDPMYKFFALDPYGRVYAGYKENKSMSRFQNVGLLKLLHTQLDCGITENPDLYFPRAQCVREEKRDIPMGYDIRAYYPGDRNGATYGKSTFDLNTYVECECSSSDGFFYVSHNDNLVVNKHIGVYFSAWVYEDFFKKDWQEYCWHKRDIQRTYNHEIQHIKNARIVSRTRYDMYMPKEGFRTKEQCLERAEARMFIIYMDWLIWKDNEILHINTNPKSPNSTGGRSYEICN